MDWKRDAPLLKDVSITEFALLISFDVAEKIGGGYFLKTSPENYYEEKLQSTDFIREDRAVNGSDAQQSIFADSFGGLNQ